MKRKQTQQPVHALVGRQARVKSNDMFSKAGMIITIVAVADADATLELAERAFYNAGGLCMPVDLSNLEVL